MESTAKPDPLATVITGSLTCSVIANDLHFGTLTASYRFEGADARNIAALGTCAVELAIDGKTIIGLKWYDAEFICRFAIQAMTRAAGSLGCNYLDTTNSISPRIRSVCQGLVMVVGGSHNATLLVLAQEVANYYRDSFQVGVAAANEAGQSVEFDAPAAAYPAA